MGSADPNRAYDPELKHADQATLAAEQLGRELARFGCHIVVYSSDPQFIEAHVVRGYVASGKAQEGSIQVRFPDGSPAATFPEYETNPGIFSFSPDPSRDWEVSFYRSLVVSMVSCCLAAGSRYLSPA